MKGSGLTRRVFVGLLTLTGTGGCVEILERVKPDRISVGVTARQIEGAYKGFKVKTVMPVWEVRAKKKLADSLDAYGRIQFNQGTLSAQHDILWGKAEGDFESLGVGLNYFPLDTRAIGLEVGLEIFRAEYEMQGGLGPIRQITPDRFWGGGLNLGAVGKISLDKKRRWHFVWGAGYNFTETDARKAKADLDGWYGIVGIEINLTGKK